LRRRQRIRGRSLRQAAGVVVAIFSRLYTGGRRRFEVVWCDTCVETQALTVAKAASIATLEQFKISADRESLALRLSSNLQLHFPQICSRFNRKETKQINLVWHWSLIPLLSSFFLRCAHKLCCQVTRNEAKCPSFALIKS